MTRAAQARLLAGPLWRSGAWWAVPATTAAMVSVTGALRLAGADVPAAVATGGGTFLLAAVAGFALDDDARATVAASPSPPAFRTGLRLLGAYGGVAVCWAALLAYATSFAPPVAVAHPTLLLTTLVTIALLTASRWGGTASAPAVIVFLAGAGRLPDRWSVLGDAPGATGRLAAVLVVVAGALVLRCRRDRTGY